MPRQKSLRYVIGCFEREEISRSLFLRVYISINCRLSVGALLRAKKKKEVATTDGSSTRKEDKLDYLF